MTSTETEQPLNDASTPMVKELKNSAALSVVSKKYDRGQKGYLDSTELEIRELDTENRGYLDVDKVYEIMKELRAEQKSSMTLKKIIYALSGFAILLAFANIGTSFAAAKLASDSHVNSHTHDLVDKGTGERLGTTPKIDVIVVETEDARRLRGVYDDATEEQEWDDGERRTQTDVTDSANGQQRISEAGAVELFSKVCSGFDQSDFNSIKSGASFSCTSVNAEGVLVSYCDGYTLFKMRLVNQPVKLSRNSKRVVFKYEAFKGDWKYDNIKISCPVNGNQDCKIIGDTKGLTCDQTCETCADFKRVHWFCDAATECSCHSQGVCDAPYVADLSDPFDFGPIACSMPASCAA